MKEINWENVSMEIISLVGEAKSSSIIAIDLAENKEYKKAEDLIIKAEKLMVEAELKHMDIIVLEAQGNDLPFKLLFMHAEDQLLSTQTIILMAKKIINIYKKIQ